MSGAPQVKPHELAVGQRMRDKVSGFVGVADAKIEFLSGTFQFNLIQATKEDGNHSDGRSFDSHQLEFVECVVEAAPEPKDTGIVLGSKVRDIVTDVIGIATLKTTFINGCVYYTVATKDTKKQPTTMAFFDYKRLEVIGNGVVEQIVRLKPPVGNEKPPGGPSYKIPMRG